MHRLDLDLQSKTLSRVCIHCLFSAGGSVRLVNLHKVVRHGTPRASMVHEAEAFAPAACLAISPSTPTTFLVGAGAGSVTRGALHAPQPSPQVLPLD